MPLLLLVACWPVTGTVAAKEAEMEAVLAPFRPIVQDIVHFLTRLMELDADHKGVPNSNSDMKEFRTDIFDMLRDVAFINGSINLLAFVFKSMMAGQQKAWNQVCGLLAIAS